MASCYYKNNIRQLSALTYKHHVLKHVRTISQSQFGKEKAALQQDVTDAKRKCEEAEKLYEKEKAKAKVAAATPDPQLEKLQVRISLLG